MNSPREGGDSADKTVLGLIIQMPKYKEVKKKSLLCLILQLPTDLSANWKREGRFSLKIKGF